MPNIVSCLLPTCCNPVNGLKGLFSDNHNSFISEGGETVTCALVSATTSKVKSLSIKLLLADEELTIFIIQGGHSYSYVLQCTSCTDLTNVLQNVLINCPFLSMY